MRLFVLLAAAIALSACGRGSGTEPFTESRLAPGAPVGAWPPAGWAWGLLKLSDRPALRYGVSAPSGVPAGDVVILPSYGESIEWWFETARDLNREGCTVWILDGSGQGGSGRSATPRDLGHVSDFEGDIQGFAALIKIVIRPPPDRPVQVIASGTAVLTALAAAERGAPVKRMILSAPVERTGRAGGLPSLAASVGIRSFRASGETGWVRPDPAARMSRRRKTALGWAVANPDLRMGGPSAGWLIARQKLKYAVMQPDALAAAKIPMVMITPGNDADLCGALPRCLLRPLPSREPYHVAEDAARAAWIAAVVAELSDHAP